MLGKTLSNVFEKLQSTGKLIVYETQKNVRLRKRSWRFSIACQPRVKDVTSKAIGFCLTQKHFFAPHLHLILNCLFLFWLAFQLSLMHSARYLLGDISNLLCNFSLPWWKFYPSPSKTFWNESSCKASIFEFKNEHWVKLRWSLSGFKPTFLVKFSGHTNEQYVCDGEQTQLPHGNLAQFSTHFYGDFKSIFDVDLWNDYIF